MAFWEYFQIWAICLGVIKPPINQCTRPGKRLHFANWKITMLSMGKSTISTGPCSIATCNKLPEGIPSYIPLNPIKSPLNHHWMRGKELTWGRQAKYPQRMVQSNEPSDDLQCHQKNSRSFYYYLNRSSCYINTYIHTYIYICNYIYNHIYIIICIYNHI